MRILHVSHYYPPETHGGTQEYVAELAALQRADGHEVGVVAGARMHSEVGEVRLCEQDGVPVWRLLRDLEAERLSGDMGCERLAGAVERIAAEFAPDLVHVHHWQALSRDLVRRLKARGWPVLLTLHDLFTTCPRFFRMPDHRSFCRADVGFGDCAACVAPDVAGIPPSQLEGMLVQRAAELQAELGAADAVLAVSAAQRDLLQSLPAFSYRDVKVLPIGIRGVEAPPAPQPLPGALRLVNWAGLDPRKGIHVLLEAVAGSDRRESFAVHLHGRDGDPEYMEELRELAVGCDVAFHGEFGESERSSFAGRYDLAVFPFLAFETYGLVVDEALHGGIPVVVPDHGAPPERIGTRGVVFPTGDATALRALLEGLLDAPARLAAMRAGVHEAKTLAGHHRDLLEVYATVRTAPG